MGVLSPAQRFEVSNLAEKKYILALDQGTTCPLDTLCADSTTLATTAGACGTSTTDFLVPSIGRIHVTSSNFPPMNGATLLSGVVTRQRP